MRICVTSPVVEYGSIPVREIIRAILEYQKTNISGISYDFIVAAIPPVYDVGQSEQHGSKTKNLVRRMLQKTMPSEDVDVDAVIDSSLMCYEQEAFRFNEFSPDEFNIVFDIGGQVTGDNVFTLGEEEEFLSLKHWKDDDVVTFWSEIKHNISSILCSYIVSNRKEVRHVKPEKEVVKSDKTLSEELFDFLEFGFSGDVEVFEDSVKKALRELFLGKEDSDWNRFLMQCLIQGMSFNLVEIRTMYPDWSDEEDE